MEPGELATRWTVRVAMLLYVLTLATRRRLDDRVRRWLWTLGFLAYLAHVACAFHFIHHGSHDEAYAHTARQTRELVGLDWGGGIYANHVFTLVWLADVVWWWTGIDRCASRPRAVRRAIHGYLAFIAFNAAVVFAAGPTRWIGAVLTVLLLAHWLGSTR